VPRRSEPGWNFLKADGKYVHDGEGRQGHLYTHPYPVSDRKFLVSCKVRPADHFQQVAQAILTTDTVEKTAFTKCDRCWTYRDDVQSEGERRISDWLTAHGLAYRYDSKFRLIAEFQIRPDFYLPELDVYIEYWGLNTPQYKMSMYKKQMLYQQEGKRLISVYPKDLPVLDDLLTAKLHHFGFTCGMGQERQNLS